MPNIRADERHGAPLQRVLNFVGDLLEIYSTRYRATVPYSPAIPSQASVHPHGRPLVNRFTGAARAVTLSVPHQRWMAGQFEARIEAFVAHYNHLHYHESIDNLTPMRSAHLGMRVMCRRAP